AIERDPGGRVAPAGGLAAELGEFLGVDDREPAGAGAAEVDDGDRAGRRLAGGLEDPGPGPRRLLPLAFGVQPHAGVGAVADCVVAAAFEAADGGAVGFVDRGYLALAAAAFVAGGATHGRASVITTSSGEGVQAV